MELFEDIRVGHRAGASIRELSDKHRVHRRTVRQAIAEAVPPARKRPDRGFPVAGRWEPVVRGWLVADHYEKYKIISKGILYDPGCRFPRCLPGFSRF